MKQYNSPRFVFFVLCIVFAIPFFTAQTQLSTAQTPFCALISTPTEFHQFDDGAVGNVEQIQSANWSPNGKYIAFWLQRISTSKIISDPEKWLQIWDASQTTKIVELVFDQYSYPTDITW